MYYIEYYYYGIKGGSKMNGYIKKQEVIGLEDSIQQIINESDSPHVKEYFQSVLDLPKEEQSKWFLTSNEVSRMVDERLDPVLTCTVIKTVCVVIATVVTVYNAVTKKYEEKEVKEKRCEEKEVQVPCNNSSSSNNSNSSSSNSSSSNNSNSSSNNNSGGGYHPGMDYPVGPDERN